MKEIIIGALLPVGIGAVFALWGALLNRVRTYKWGFKCGELLSALLGQKAKGGMTYERNEDKVQTTIADFCRGVVEGMDSDDEIKWVEKKSGN